VATSKADDPESRRAARASWPIRRFSLGDEPPEEYSPEEGRELAGRLDEVRATGGAPHATIRQEMLDDMERDLRRMVNEYDGTAGRAKELLEALVIARENGVKACDELEQELAVKLRSP
jgi:hypothetical protein